MIHLGSIDINRYWFFRYKLYHFIFWGIYHIMLGTVQYSLIDIIQWILYSDRYIVYVSYVMIHTLAVFVNLYWLIPRYLEKGKLGKYTLYLTLCILVASLFTQLGVYFAAYVSGYELRQLAYPYTNRYHFITYFFAKAVPSMVGTMVLAMSIKLSKHWSQAKKRQLALEKEKLETELNFLKAQFNPHFLFNTINSIFFLIPKDPQLASATLARFSELLRYQLYECNEEKIALSNEITYLENVIALEKLRKNDDLEVRVNIDKTQVESLHVAPFILLTFIENAFKHVSKHKEAKNWIEINLSIKEAQILELRVCNSVDVSSHSPVDAGQGGIGLVNTQRRLELVYPDKHTLSFQEQAGVFEVYLLLELKIDHDKILT